MHQRTIVSSFDYTLLVFPSSCRRTARRDPRGANGRRARIA